MIIWLLFLFLGFITFPILFYFQKLFKLPPPNLKKENFHLHHSFYGLLIVIAGIVLLFGHIPLGLKFIAYGLGFVIHHEISEPGLKGVSKFIYFKNKK